MNWRAPLVLALAWACGSHGPAEYPGFVDEPVAPVAAQASGRVVALHVREGDRVTSGELLAELDSGEAKALVDQAQANLDRAQSTLAQARANYHVAVPAVTGAGAEVARAVAAAHLAKLEYDRSQRLFATKAIAQADLDKARAAYDEAEATVASLAAGKTQAQHRVPAASAVVGDAEAAVAAAKAALDLAEVRLAYTRITSPFDGMVVSRDSKKGSGPRRARRSSPSKRPRARGCGSTSPRPRSKGSASARRRTSASSRSAGRRFAGASTRSAPRATSRSTRTSSAGAPTFARSWCASPSTRRPRACGRE